MSAANTIHRGGGPPEKIVAGVRLADLEKDAGKSPLSALRGAMLGASGELHRHMGA